MLEVKTVAMNVLGRCDFYVTDKRPKVLVHLCADIPDHLAELLDSLHRLPCVGYGRTLHSAFKAPGHALSDTDEKLTTSAS